MPVVILVRHGENEFVKKGRLAGRLPGVHLNERGRNQAQAAADFLGEKLKEAQVKCIYSSPFERAVETAQPIAAALNVEIEIREKLLETDCGEWQGKTVKSLNRLKVWKVVQVSPSSFTFPGGETFFESQHRIVSEIQTLVGMHEEKDVIVCVSHADPIRLAIAYFLGMPLDTFQRLIVSPASINILGVGEMGGRLITLNYTPAFELPK